MQYLQSMSRSACGPLEHELNPEIQQIVRRTDLVFQVLITAWGGLVLLILLRLLGLWTP